MASTRRTAWVVYESLFGNTATLARAVASGLRHAGWRTVVFDLALEAPPEICDADLLVLGAPTHARSLSDGSTRADAVRQGADPRRQSSGLREWLEHLQPGPHETPDVVAFDCRWRRSDPVEAGAAACALRIAELAGFGPRAAPMVFHVDDAAGPLVLGEGARAWAWGAAIVPETRIERSLRIARDRPASCATLRA